MILDSKVKTHVILSSDVGVPTRVRATWSAVIATIGLVTTAAEKVTWTVFGFVAGTLAAVTTGATGPAVSTTITVRVTAEEMFPATSAAV